MTKLVPSGVSIVTSFKDLFLVSCSVCLTRRCAVLIFSLLSIIVNSLAEEVLFSSVRDWESSESHVCLSSTAFVLISLYTLAANFFSSFSSDSVIVERLMVNPSAVILRIIVRWLTCLP